MSLIERGLDSEKTIFDKVIGVDLFACHLSEAHKGSRHCTAAAMLLLDL